MAMDRTERVWLRNPTTGGYFRCPARAAQSWIDMGWERSDPPPPAPSPVVAERLRWQAEQRAASTAAATQSRTRRSAAPRAEEMTDG